MSLVKWVSSSLSCSATRATSLKLIDLSFEAEYFGYQIATIFSIKQTTFKCYHIIAARMAFGLVDKHHRKPLNLAQLRRNKRKRTDEALGLKLPRADDNVNSMGIQFGSPILLQSGFKE